LGKPNSASQALSGDPIDVSYAFSIRRNFFQRFITTLCANTTRIMNGANGQFADSQNGTIGTNATSNHSKQLWEHSSPKSTAMYKFLQHVNKKYSLQLANYEALQKWSTEEIGEFWGTCWDHLGIRAKSPPAMVRTFIYALNMNVC